MLNKLLHPKTGLSKQENHTVDDWDRQGVRCGCALAPIYTLACNPAMCISASAPMGRASLHHPLKFWKIRTASTNFPWRLSAERREQDSRMGELSYPEQQATTAERRLRALFLCTRPVACTKQEGSGGRTRQAISALLRRAPDLGHSLRRRVSR